MTTTSKTVPRMPFWKSADNFPRWHEWMRSKPDVICSRNMVTVKYGRGRRERKTTAVDNIVMGNILLKILCMGKDRESNY